jgi:predicted acyl esterase
LATIFRLRRAARLDVRFHDFRGARSGLLDGRGYAVITADVPGTWFAETEASYFSPREAQCHYDLIEWAGTQPWSNGKVGLRECPIFRRASGKWPR